MILAELRSAWRARHLLWVLTRREMAARHAGSAGGIAWAYAQPLLLIAAYYLVFDVVFAMRLGEGAPTRAVGAYLVVGALPWAAFCDAIGRGAASLVEAGEVLRKNPLPPVLFPLRAAAASALVFGPLFAVLLLAYAPSHGFGWPVTALPLVMALQLVLVTVLGYLLAIMVAAIRDTGQVITFFLSVGIFLSPVLFPVSLFPEGWRWALWINPMTPLVLGYQAILLQGAWPPADMWIGALAWIAFAGLLLETALRRSLDQLVDWL